MSATLRNTRTARTPEQVSNIAFQVTMVKHISEQIMGTVCEGVPFHEIRIILNIFLENFDLWVVCYDLNMTYLSRMNLKLM